MDNTREHGNIELESNNYWYERIWFLLTNLFTYIFKGKIRF